MSDISNKTHLKLPIIFAISGVISVFGAGGVWAVTKYRQDDTDKRIDALAAVDVKLEAKIDKQAEANARVMELLGRIDERTASTAKQLSELSRQK